MNIYLVVFQIGVNVFCGWRKKQVGRKFKILALLFFPVVAALLPLIQSLIQLAQVLSEIFGAKTRSMPVLVPVGFEGSILLSSWLLQILLAIGIQFVFNQWLFTILQQRGTRI